MSSQDLLADLSGFKKWLAVVVSIGVAITADTMFPGWGRFTATTCLLASGLLLLWRRFWVRWTFWALLLVVLVLHVVFALKMRLWINSIDPFAWFAVTIIEVLVAGLILSFVDR